MKFVYRLYTRWVTFVAARSGAIWANGFSQAIEEGFERGDRGYESGIVEMYATLPSGGEVVVTVACPSVAAMTARAERALLN